MLVLILRLLKLTLHIIKTQSSVSQTIFNVDIFYSIQTSGTTAFRQHMGCSVWIITCHFNVHRFFFFFPFFLPYNEI